MIFTMLIVVGTSSALVSTSKTGAQMQTSDITEELKSQDVYERNVKLTSRSEDRKPVVKVAKAVFNYKKIDEIRISRDMDLTITCGVSREDFIKLMTNLRVDTSGFFEKNAGIIYDLCQKYELNEIFFCGLIAGESGWNIASSHRNTHNYISMMSRGKLIRYSSDAEGLEAAAKLLHNRYLTPGGSYYRGKT